MIDKEPMNDVPKLRAFLSVLAPLSALSGQKLLSRRRQKARENQAGKAPRTAVLRTDASPLPAEDS
jgi:hypothetical protein